MVSEALAKNMPNVKYLKKKSGTKKDELRTVDRKYLEKLIQKHIDTYQITEDVVKQLRRKYNIHQLPQNCNCNDISTNHC